MLRRSILRAGLPPVNHTPAKYAGPAYAEVMAKRAQYLHPILVPHFPQPLMVVEGHMQYIYDEKGTRYLDMFGGVCTTSVGHAHPRVVKAVQEQVAKVAHLTHLYVHPAQVQFAEKIVSKMPKEEEWVVMPTNSGSEANDFAITMAKLYTGNQSVVSLRHGYHGLTEGVRGLCCVKNWRYPVAPPGGNLKTLAPETYRGVLGTRPEDVPKYISDVSELIVNDSGNRVAAFIAESIQGVGGLQTLIPGYLPKAYEAVRAAGGLCISDEVQCAFGRLGTHYWGFETHGSPIIPDIVTCAKSVANGLPMGVVIVKKKIAEKMKGTLFFNTFGGNPISSAAAYETLKIIDEENLQSNAVTVGDHLLAGLKKLQAKFPVIGDIRGRGFMIGVELVKNPVTKEPAGDYATLVHNGLKDRFIVIGKGGNGGNVLRLQGPMCATIADANYFLGAFEEVLPALK